MQGNCAKDVPTTVPRTPGQCILDIRQPLLNHTMADPALLLLNLYARVASAPIEAPPAALAPGEGIISTAGNNLWLANVTVEGAGSEASFARGATAVVVDGSGETRGNLSATRAPPLASCHPHVCLACTGAALQLLSESTGHGLNSGTAACSVDRDGHDGCGGQCDDHHRHAPRQHGLATLELRLRQHGTDGLRSDCVWRLDAPAAARLPRAGRARAGRASRIRWHPSLRLRHPLGAGVSPLVPPALPNVQASVWPVCRGCGCTGNQHVWVQVTRTVPPVGEEPSGTAGEAPPGILLSFADPFFQDLLFVRPPCCALPHTWAAVPVLRFPLGSGLLVLLMLRDNLW